MDDTGGMHVFQATLGTRLNLGAKKQKGVTRTHQYLVEEVLDELLLKRTRGEETV